MLVTDLGKFGIDQLYEAEKLLEAMRLQGLPHDFFKAGVCPAWNNESGLVFLINDEYQVCMFNRDKPYLKDSYSLESWYNCPICGGEGFWDEFEKHSVDEECLEYVEELKECI